MATGVLLDPDFGTIVQNETDLPTSEIYEAMRGDHEGGRLLASLAQWTQTTQGGMQRRNGGLFERDRYVTPVSVYDQMRLAYQAVESDDIVSGVVETTEALAFSRVSFYAEDEDDEDIYNQIAADIDLDSRLREMWRELFTVSQFYCAVWWHTKQYKVRGKTDKGNAKRKEYNVRCPKALTLLDPLKVVPVGNSMFNRESLCYIADRSEATTFDQALDRKIDDPIVTRLVLARYQPGDVERRQLGNLGVDPSNLFLLNPATVFRHTATRPQFQMFASVRMKSVFELLDLKHQLREMDRAHVIGGTNFIVLITKGSDQHPAKQPEIDNLQGQVRTVGRVPVLVGDHRLKVEIITPKLDNTIKPERYNTIDSRITARLYQMFLLGNYAAGAAKDDSGGLVKVIARGMESRRHMLRRTLEANIWDAMFEQNESLTTSPRLDYHPKQIALDFDPNFASFLMELRQSNEISRATILSQFDMDQADEARLLEREHEKYDDTFMTQVPFSSTNPALPGGAAPGGTGSPRGGGSGGGGGAALPPHSHGPDGTPVPLPAPAGGAAKKAAGATKKAAPVTTPAQKRAAGRTGGGNRNGGGSAPGTGQGQAPRNPRKKAT